MFSETEETTPVLFLLLSPRDLDYPNVSLKYLDVYNTKRGFPCSSVVRNLLVKAGAEGLILGMGRSPAGGHGNPLQYSCLENPMDRGAWRLQSMGSQRVGYDSVTKQQYKTVAKNFSKTASVDLFTRWKSKPLWPVLFFLMDRFDQIMTLFRNLYLSTSDLLPVFSDALYCSENISSSLFSLQTPILFCTCLSAAISPEVAPPPLLLHTRPSLIFETRSAKLSSISYQNSVAVILVPVV